MVLKVRSDLFQKSAQWVSSSVNVHENPQKMISSESKMLDKTNVKLQKDKTQSKVRFTNQKTNKKMKTQNYVQQEKVVRFSNDLMDSCRTLCKLCNDSIILSKLEQHIKTKHSLNSSEYKKMYGKPVMEKLIFHKCGLCSFVLLLDSDFISQHLKTFHQITQKHYNSTYMQKRGKKSPVKNIENITDKELENMSEDDLLEVIDEVML